MPKRDRRGISERIEAERGGVKTEREVNISWQAQRFDDVFLHFPALLLPSWSFFVGRRSILGHRHVKANEL